MKKLIANAQKLIANAPIFVSLYVLLMIPTYLLPYSGSNSLFVNSMVAGMASVYNQSTPLSMYVASFAHVACLLLLAMLAFFRGKHFGKTWIVVLPVLALIFDFVPGFSLIPLVPTVMHLATIIIGVKPEREIVFARAA